MSPSFDLRSKKILVLGLARTGGATALFCARHGAVVTAADVRGEKDLRDARIALETAGISVKLEQQNTILLEGMELVVVSPGVPADSELIRAARSAGLAVWSEIELARRFLKGRLIGITGSNGKTTTTSLIEHILRAAGMKTLLAGNIGTPLISVVEHSSTETITVAELSSFQLELITNFRPDISVLLNITPDHLDRHKTMDLYTAAKIRIFENQIERDFAVLNADDPMARELAPSRPQVFRFGHERTVPQGSFVHEGEIVFRNAGKEQRILRTSDIPLVGGHNLENVLAAVAATRLAGAEAGAIAEGIRTFAGVEHRLEFVAEIAGVKYYNDSKATNVDATQKALQAFAGRMLVILGGKDKGSDYTALRESLRERAVLALLIGAATEKIAAQIAGSVEIVKAENLQRAVTLAAAAAQPGDIVLLAPACASFDQFRDYEERGQIFKELVHRQATLEKASASRTVKEIA